MKVNHDSKHPKEDWSRTTSTVGRGSTIRGSEGDEMLSADRMEVDAVMEMVAVVLVVVMVLVVVVILDADGKTI